MTWSILESDALAALRAMPDAHVDSVVTDPPAGIKFRGAEWDGDKGGRDAWIAWLAEIFAELRRVAKPGAHAVVWALPRTSHWTATAMENAGWEIRDCGVHLFGQGYPKNLNVARAISVEKCSLDGRHFMSGLPKEAKRRPGDHVCPDHPDASPFEGRGTLLKPAAEHWILARAPLREKTIAGNVLANGTGALNIDPCRLATGSEGSPAAARRASARASGNAPMSDLTAAESNALGVIGRRGSAEGDMEERSSELLGRFPPNVTLEHTDQCMLTGTKKVRSGTAHRASGGLNFGDGAEKPALEDMTYADADGFEEVEDWRCPPECAVRMLDEQSGECPGMTGGGIPSLGYGRGMFGAIDSPRTARGDSGGASRFFYTAKPARSEKEKGLDWMPSRKVNDGRAQGGAGNDNPRLRGASDRKNHHTTVKPVALMRWLCKLVTPPGGLVLDPFAGSGTTLVAALADGFRCIGIEQNPEFVALAKARVEGDAPLLNRKSP